MKSSVSFFLHLRTGIAKGNVKCPGEMSGSPRTRARYIDLPIAVAIMLMMQPVSPLARYRGVLVECLLLI